MPVRENKSWRESDPYGGGVRVPDAPLRIVRIHGLSPYRPLWDLQNALCEKREKSLCEDTLLLLEHTPTITLGRSAREENLLEDQSLLEKSGFEIVRVNRGGDVTYHGPGQLTGYLIMDLKELRLNLHQFVAGLEEVMIRTSAGYGIQAGRVAGLTGVWVGEHKIGAIGVHIKRWISTHGFAFNVKTDLQAFGHIVPCGIRNRGVTSVASFGKAAPRLDEVEPDDVASDNVEINDVARKLGCVAGDVFRRKTYTIEFASSIEALKIL